jgi:hypothetical protein
MECKMNERIKQILGQAYDQAVPETWTTLSSEQLERVYEKFAELIVRECDRYVAEQYDETEPWMQPGDLLKHFGVEE